MPADTIVLVTLTTSNGTRDYWVKQQLANKIITSLSEMLEYQRTVDEVRIEVR